MAVHRALVSSTFTTGATTAQGFGYKPSWSRLGVFASRSVKSAMASQAKKVLVPIANGTEEMEAVIIIDVLRRAGADVTVASVEDELKVVASRDVKLVADAPITDCVKEIYDLLVLPGGATGAEHLRDSKPLQKIAQSQAEQQRFYAAICAAPAVALEPWGLLKGLQANFQLFSLLFFFYRQCNHVLLQATCHPSFTSKLSNQASVELRVVSDGLVLTSRGPGTAMEFALSLVKKLYNKDKADEISKGLILRSEDSCSAGEFNKVHWSSANSSQPRILVPVANGTEEMEAVIIIDVLRRAGAEVVVASVEETLEIIASRRVRIEADRLIGEVGDAFDAVLLPGGMPGAEHLRDSKELQSILLKQAQEQRVYGAICASPAVVLESSKLLAGKKATSFPAFQSKLGDQSAVKDRVVIDGLVVTSQGPGTAMEFAVEIVNKFFGKQAAVAVSKPMLFNYN